MPLFPSRETLIHDAGFLKFYGSIRQKTHFRNMLGSVRDELSSTSFDARGCDGIQVRALRDAKMEGVEEAIDILSSFLDVTPKATAQSDLTEALIEDKQKESE